MYVANRNARRDGHGDVYVLFDAADGMHDSAQINAFAAQIAVQFWH